MAHAIRGKIRLYKNGILQKERYYWGRAQRNDIIAAWKPLVTTNATWEYEIAPYMRGDDPSSYMTHSRPAKQVVEVSARGEKLEFFSSKSEAIQKTGLTQIPKVLSGSQRHTKGRYFKYA